MKTLYFDTSTINCLFDDPRCSEITENILEKYIVYLSFIILQK